MERPTSLTKKNLLKKGVLILVVLLGISLIVFVYNSATAKMPATLGVNFSGETSITKITQISGKSIAVAFTLMIIHGVQNIHAMWHLDFL